ncbi:MAG: hypothetical protein JXM74_10035 [Fusobacteriaceae bacterium]|nr:hypothetical protein [Fusobacteriaceae bacterium]
MKRGERQAHGFIFQDWIVGRFLDMAYTAEWDIPKKINNFSHKNISIKTAKWKSNVGLGDALNQFNINEDFEMLVAFYKEENDKKIIVNMQLIEISKDKWRELWGNMTEEKIKRLVSLIKHDNGRGLSGQELEDFRAEVQELKRELTEDYTGSFSLHPKIDSKIQRRLQCSISFEKLFHEFQLDKKIMKTYKLWGDELRLNKINLN